MNRLRKTTATLLIVLLVSIVFGVPVLAVKPSGNLAGAEKVLWNLSAEVTKVPPYGSRDIPGSDDASKLIVNQPNGAVEVVITGDMGGLNPNTVYTVYLSKEYKQEYQRWSLIGDWVLEFDLNTKKYIHDMSITEETDTTFSGTGTNSHTWVVTGTKSGSGISITMKIDYDGSIYEVNAIGTIDTDTGEMSGTWTGPGQSGTWISTDGEAIFKGMVGTGWPGLFTNTIPSFTFTTDAYGSGSWHLNLRDSDFGGKVGTFTLSIWINASGGTLLISDNFGVTVD